MTNLYNHTRGRVRYFDIAFKTSKSNDEIAEKIFVAMKKAVLEASKINIVHTNLTMLPTDGHKSDLGFTAVLLLDESHFTAHSYHPPSSTKNGHLACDLFTCGEGTIDLIAAHFHNALDLLFDSYKIKFIECRDRFTKHDDDEPELILPLQSAD